MKVRLVVPPDPIIWQCLYHALADYQKERKAMTSYLFEIPEGDLEVIIRKIPEITVTWKLLSAAAKP